MANQDWETPCPGRSDGIHCTCWYDGDECCGCGDPAKEMNEDGTPIEKPRGPHPIFGEESN